MIWVCISIGGPPTTTCVLACVFPFFLGVFGRSPHSNAHPYGSLSQDPQDTRLLFSPKFKPMCSPMFPICVEPKHTSSRVALREPGRLPRFFPHSDRCRHACRPGREPGTSHRCAHAPRPPALWTGGNGGIYGNDVMH